MVTQGDRKFLHFGGTQWHRLTIPLSVWMRTLVIGSLSFSPLAIAAAGLLLATVALFATYLPARRAASIQPMTALRTE